MMRPFFRGQRIALMLAAALALGALVGCDAAGYEPSGENFVEVDPPATGVTIDLETEGPLAVWGEVTLRYSLDLGGRTLRLIEFYIDGDLFDTTTSPSSFRFASTDIPDGRRTLRMVVYVASGTGSLADRLGAEIVFTQTQTTLDVDNAPPTPVQILGVEAYEGRARLQWSPYTRANFQEYRVYSDHPGMGDPVVITDPNETSWVDPFLIGGAVTYRVVVHANGTTASQDATFETPIPGITALEFQDENVLRIAWEASLFPENVTEYAVERPAPWGSGWTTIGTTTAGTDTELVIEVADVFADNAPYRLQTRNGNFIEVTEENPLMSIQTDVWIGVSDPVYLPASDSYVGLAIDAFEGVMGLKRLAAGSLTVEASQPLSGSGYPRVFATRDGSRLFTTSGGIVREHDPNTLAVVGTLDLNASLGYDVRLLDPVVSDDGVLFFSRIGVLGSALHYGRGVLAVDLDDEAIVASMAPPATGGISMVSAAADGRHVVIQVQSSFTLHRVDEATQSFEPVEPGSGALLFIGAGDRVARSSGGTISVFSVDPFEELYSFPAATLRETFYDRTLGHIAGYREAMPGEPGAEFFVYDLEDGTEVTRLWVERYVSTQLHLVNGTLWGRGYYRDLATDQPRARR